MPRRPRKHANNGKPRPVNHADSKLKKWKNTSDIPMDEEDLFHASKDKVLLEGNSYNHDDDGDEDEVFPLKGLEDEDQDEEEQDIEMEDETEEDIPLPTPKVRTSKKGKLSVQSSDEDESLSEEEAWGRGKSAYYASNAADLESDDEEGNELEELEAKRLQAKTREEMGDSDFGLNDPLDNKGAEERDEPATIVEPLPQDKNTLIRHLEKTSPEALALARDWEDTVQRMVRTKDKLESMQSESSDPTLGMMHLFYQTLLTYATTLAFYLHLRASERYAQKPELLKSHLIMARLLTLKQSLSTLDDLDFAPSDFEEDEVAWNADMNDGEDVLNIGESLEEGELQDLLADAISHNDGNKLKEPPRKKRKISAVAKPVTVVFDLIEPDFSNSGTSPSRRPSSGLTDSYGESLSLQPTDAADKFARKKSLRFHTAKIETVSARRGGARRQAMGGDDDLPYRERRKVKGSPLAKEITSKTSREDREDLDDTEPEPKSLKGGKKEMDELENPDGYYELVKKTAKARKERNKVEYETAHRRPYIDDEGDSTGPRSLTRAILANKGLTPHRPKSVRNPRIKKRLKFEKAKKKLSSQKATFKGGLGDIGRYEGEKSGISKVVKSVRLG